MRNSLDTHSLREILLQEDDTLMGYKKNDKITVDLKLPPTSGKLVIIESNNRHYICRYENIDGNKFLWPPRGFDPREYDSIILGQAVELSRSLD